MVERIKDIVPFALMKYGRDGFSTTIKYVDIYRTERLAQGEVRVEFTNDRIHNPVTMQGLPENLAQNLEMVVDQLKEMARAIRDSDQSAAVQDTDGQV